MGLLELQQIRQNRDKPKIKKQYTIPKKSAKTIAREKDAIEQLGKPVQFAIGQRFNRYVIIGIEGKADNGHYIMKCRCDCGVEKNVEIQALRSGNTKSCGCLISEVTADRNRTHGNSNTREYKIWGSMKSRCLNENTESYHRYGGRGIEICPEWVASFDAFISDMGRAPSSAHTIDRENNSMGYSKENCRWVTKDIQSRNRDENLYVEYNGKRQVISDWSKELGIPLKTLYDRYHKGYIEDELFFVGKMPSANAGITRWFQSVRAEMTGVCAHCGQKSCKDNDTYYKFSIAHILPKAYFKSVATHPLNWIELCHFGNSCHAQMDNRMLDLMDMNCFDEIIRKFVSMYRAIEKSERKRIPAVLMNYIEVEI